MLSRQRSISHFFSYENKTVVLQRAAMETGIVFSRDPA
jgi:hypothetical protein